jgi:DNA-binding IclR family transcriptional regulator
MKNGEKSLAKAFDVIETVGRIPNGIAAKDLAAEMGMPVSTLFRIVKFLVERRFLRKEDTLLTLGPAAARLGGQALRQNPLSRVAHPILAKLAEETCETVHLAELRNDAIVYIDKVEGSRSVRMGSLIGNLGEFYCSGVGKVILAFQPPARQRKLIESITFEKFTETTITDAAALREELTKIRHAGYAIDNCEHELGVFCIAAPLRDAAGVAFAGISISGSELYLRDRLTELVKLTRQAALDISHELG